MATWLVNLEWSKLIPMLLAGIINLFVAYPKLYNHYHSPLFDPIKSPSIWLWGIVQISIPALAIFLYSLSCSEVSWITAIIIGFAFITFINADADLGFTSIPIGQYYEFLNRQIYGAISYELQGKTAHFKQNLTQELSKIEEANLNQGLERLKDYFHGDPTELTETHTEVQQALETTDLEQKSTKAKSLILKVRRKDCADILETFGCNPEILKPTPKRKPNQGRA